MKKTITMLLALACSVASAALTPEDAENILSTATVVEGTSYDLTSANTGNLTFVGVVDMEKFITLRNTVTTSNHPVFLTIIDSQNNTMGAMLGDTTTKANILFDTALKQWDSTGDITNRGGWTTATGFCNAEDAVITFSYGAGSGTEVMFSYLNDDDDLAQNTRTDGGLHYSKKTITTLTFSDLFSKVYLIEGTKYTGADTQALAKAALVPEPATATLSLLALAGLAARRRRH